MTKPPPTPKKPVSSPTPVAAAATLRARRATGLLNRRHQAAGSGRVGDAGGACLSSVATSVAPDDTERTGRTVPIAGEEPRDGPAAAGAGAPPAARRSRLQHRCRGGQHEHGEQGEQQVRPDARGEHGAGIGAGHAKNAERDPLGQADSAHAPVRGHPRQCGDPDDQQRCGGRGMRLLVQQVDQAGHGQDRAAAAQGAERQPDQQPGGDGDDCQHAASPCVVTYPVGYLSTQPYPPGESGGKYHPGYRSVRAKAARRERGRAARAGPGRRRPCRRCWRRTAAGRSR